MLSKLVSIVIDFKEFDDGIVVIKTPLNECNELFVIVMFVVFVANIIINVVVSLANELRKFTIISFICCCVLTIAIINLVPA